MEDFIFKTAWKMRAEQVMWARGVSDELEVYLELSNPALLIRVRALENYVFPLPSRYENDDEDSDGMEWANDAFIGGDNGDLGTRGRRPALMSITNTATAVGEFSTGADAREHMARNQGKRSKKGGKRVAWADEESSASEKRGVAEKEGALDGTDGSLLSPSPSTATQNSPSSGSLVRTSSLSRLANFFSGSRPVSNPTPVPSGEEFQLQVQNGDDQESGEEEQQEKRPAVLRKKNPKDRMDLEA